MNEHFVDKALNTQSVSPVEEYNSPKKSIFGIYCIWTWVLSIRVFGLLSSSLLLLPQRFGRYVLRLFSRPKRCRNNNKDEDNSPKTLNDQNHQASSQKFRQQTPEEGRRTCWPKRCGNNNKDEENSPKILNEKNNQALSQKFRQLISEDDVQDLKFWKGTVHIHWH